MSTGFNIDQATIDAIATTVAERISVQPQALTKEQAVVFCSASKSTLERAVKAGELIPVKFERKVLFLVDDLKEWLRSKRKTA